MKPTAGQLGPADVEQIVREVLRRLAPGGQTQPQQGDQGNERGEKRSGPSLSGKLISLADVEGQLAGVTTMCLRRGAVITPAARDYLKQQGIAVSRGTVAAASQTSGGVALVLGVAETAYDPTALVNDLAKRGTQVQQLARTGLSSVVPEMCDAVALGGQRGLLLTGETAAAVCLTNRRRGVRAAAASDLATVDTAIRSIACNLLVIDPRRAGTFPLQRMAERLSQAELSPSATFPQFMDK